ncbi:MAG: nucleoside recognition domain-containing protein [Myxococcota bacterium]
MNAVFLGIILVAFVTAAFGGAMDALSTAALDSAKSAVDLAISLIGYMALFLGLMKVAEDGGLLRLLARAIRPVMVRLFPDVPEDHPAMGAMIMNIAANMLGLGNAATPLGIKAMQELDSLNRDKGVATNAMVLFLAINTSGLALLPSGVVSIRAAEGSADPWGIVAPSLFATGMSTIVAILGTKLLQRLPVFRPAPTTGPPPDDETTGGSEPGDDAADEGPGEPTRAGVRGLSAFLVVSLAVLVVPPVWAAMLPGDSPRAEALRDFASTSGDWVIPVLIMALLLFGRFNGVKVYESFIEGAKEGFTTGVRIIPYLAAILVAVGMFRASGAMEALTSALGSATEPLGMPGEALPMALVRPLSGSGAFGLMSELIQTHGPDSYVGYLVSVLNGSTETTFYVLAVYFGAVGISRTRHAVFAGLSADLTAAVAAVFICQALFGHLA